MHRISVRLGVQHDYLAQVTVERAEVLDNLSVVCSAAFPKESVSNVPPVRVELLDDGRNDVVGLGGKEDNLPELREVGKEIVQAWPLGCAPAVLPGPVGMH